MSAANVPASRPQSAEPPGEVAHARSEQAASAAAAPVEPATAADRGLPTGGDALLLDDVRIDPAWSLRIPASLALRKRVLPLTRLDGRVIVACADPRDSTMLKAVERYVESPVTAVRAEPESLRRALKRIFGGVSGPSASEGAPIAVRDREGRGNEADDAVMICDELMQAAMLREASDIHLMPAEGGLRVRFRVDGVLETYRDLPAQLLAPVLSRLKVLAELDIAEKRSPQDGRFTARVGPSQRKVDVRVATLPTRHGERMTLRLLASQASAITLPSLGMSDGDLIRFEQAIQRPHGLVLLTGPTGSGKSTTLYAAISRCLETRGGNVLTVEDPIEYEMAGVSQVEVDSVDKVNFHKALRSILRHDPDVIMIGEIRDATTADVAIKSALTGHLVFSTLHTNTAAGVVTRLADMGMERFLIAATLRMSVAQRLVRRLCARCARPREATGWEAMALGRPELEGRQVYDARGCVYCAGRGYAGRIGLFEVVGVDEELSKFVGAETGEAALVSELRRRQQPLLMDDAVDKMLRGLTTVQDVINAVVTW